jgi:hypothetical protein
MGAGNQQERLDPLWIVGFVDGEGCFHVALNPQQKLRLGWQVLPEFRVVQHKRDAPLLHRLQSYFGCGQVTVNNGDRMELRIRGLESLERVVAFFELHPLESRKRSDFDSFARVVKAMREKQHLTPMGLKDIARLALSMNTKTNRGASRILRGHTPDFDR